ncbi:hypothetical protein PROFUN_13536, partial [Planoprotostelium fungivorum]
IDRESLLKAAFFVVFGCVTTWSLLIVPLLLRYNHKTLIKHLLNVRIFSVLFGIAVWLIIPFGTFLVLPSIHMLLRMLACRNENNVLMVEGFDIQCWTRAHVPYAFCGLLGFGIYFPLAIYTLPRIQTADPTSEIIRNTRFLFIQKMFYVTLVVLQTLIKHLLNVRIFSVLFGIAVWLIIPFGTFLVLPSIHMLLRMLACRNENNILMVEGVDIQCWTRDHVPYAFCGLLGFGIYFPLAIYTLPRIQTADPTFLFIQKMFYVTLVVLQTMQASFDLYPIICALIVSILLALASLDAACNVKWINRIHMLLRMLACRNENNILMVEGFDIQCWTRAHVPYAFCGLLGFGIYFPLAIYTLPRIQTADPTSEIIRNTRFLFIQKMFYVTLVVLQTMQASFDLYPIICALIVSILLALASLDAACNVKWINRAQTMVYVAAAWTSAMSMWAEITWRPDQNHQRMTAPVITLLVGYTFILIVFILMSVPSVKSFHSKTKTNLLTAFDQGVTERTPLTRSDLRPTPSEDHGDN